MSNVPRGSVSATAAPDRNGEVGKAARDGKEEMAKG